jgi:hypothetical protein
MTFHEALAIICKENNVDISQVLKRGKPGRLAVEMRFKANQLLEKEKNGEIIKPKQSKPLHDIDWKGFKFNPSKDIPLFLRKSWADLNKK